VSEEAVKQTHRIFSKSPDLRNELLEAAATGKLCILKRLNIDADSFEAALTGTKARGRENHALACRPTPVRNSQQC
jgi:hypothetical protein